MIDHASELTEASQELIDAVARHNGRKAPRLPVAKTPSPLPLPADMDQATAQLAAMLQHIDPDLGYDDWTHVQMAAYHDTGGSDEAFEIVNAWSSQGHKYCGEEELRSKWNSFGDYTGTPVTIRTLIKMLADRGIHWIDVCDAVEPQFVRCEYKVIHPNDQSPIPPSEPDNPLNRYSLKGKLQQLEKEAVNQVFILMYIALMGQITVFYAAPNTGKTLITLWLLIQAIKLGKVDPSKIYYINVDDSQAGLVEKLRLAEEHDFHTITEGRSDFRTNDLLDILTDLIVNGQSKGVVIILDTLKKFTDLMDKRRSTEFSKVIRRFVMQGGTCIALAHTNKNLGRDGKPVYAGTSDIIEDADCAYTLQVVSDADARERVVAFVNIKRRGNVNQRAAYCYSNDDGLSYSDLFDSVKPVDGTELVILKQAAELRSDAEVIDVVIACIQEGIDTKIKLKETVAERSGISKKAANRLIEKYTGTDHGRHKWTYTVRERGAQVFRLLDPGPIPDSPEDTENLKS
jgi:hypothetical protein